MSKEVEILILGSVLHNAEYSKKVFPFIKDKYFSAEHHVAITKLVLGYHDKYSAMPNRDALEVEIGNVRGLSEAGFTEAKKLCGTLFDEKFAAKIEKQNTQWLLDKTEKYFKDRACLIAITDAMNIIDGTNKKLTTEAIPDILKEALNISFDVDTGHDYIEDAEARFDFYHRTEERIPFSLNVLNKYTSGGIPRKTLTVPVAPTGVGKSLFMTDWASMLLTSGYNVLYVTLELAEERVAERVDAKLFEVNLPDLRTFPKSSFDKKIQDLKAKKLGSLKFKEYSPGTFHANHLRLLLQEYKNKADFVPDVIMVDYLNLMASYRMKDSSNTYQYIKSVTEELRGVAMQFNCAIISPTQTNRSGAGNSDYGITEISESFGIVMTADMAFGFVSTPELEAIGQMKGKILKNRFGRPDGTFIVGVDRAKMTLYDIEVPMQSTPMSTAKTKSQDKPVQNKKPGLKFTDDEE